MVNDPKEQRRQEILMAAMKAFSEKGYDKTTVEDIVRLSGLSKGTLYWYFTNKEAIFTGLVEMVFDSFGQGFGAAVQATADEPPPERLRRLILSFDPPLEESFDWVGLYADFFIQAWQKPALRTVFQQGYQRYLDAIIPIVQQGIDTGVFRSVDPALTARMLIGAIDGYWFQQILDVGDAQTVLTLYAETIVRGLMKNDAKD